MNPTTSKVPLSDDDSNHTLVARQLSIVKLLKQVVNGLQIALRKVSATGSTACCFLYKGGLLD